MDYVQVIGIAAAALTTGANIPQAVKIIKTRSTESISTMTYGLLLFGLILWLIYGIIEDDLPIILANAVSAVIAAIILFLKITTKKKGKPKS